MTWQEARGLMLIFTKTHHRITAALPLDTIDRILVLLSLSCTE
jgi:hypothetical protein